MALEFDYNKIEEGFKKLPETMQHALSSPEITNAIQTIANRYKLMLDQESVLYDITAYTMLGLASSKDFVKNLSSEANIDGSIASKIADDINKEVFSSIKEQMRNIESVTQTQSDTSDLSSLNQAGDFTVEPQPTESPVHVETPKEVIEGIENPAPAQSRTDTMLIDHLLSGPVVAIEQKTVQNPAPQPPKPQTTQPAPRAADPYRESFE